MKPFETSVAFASIEAELGRPMSDVFSEISEVPVAAASLAQVYKATLKETGEFVAVKVPIRQLTPDENAHVLILIKDLVKQKTLNT